MGGIPAGIGPGGKEIPIRATPDGRLQVDAEDGSAATDDLLRALICEVRELRRVTCEATDQPFEENPGDAGE